MLGIAEYTNPTFRMVEAKNGISYHPQDLFVCPKIPGPKNPRICNCGVGIGKIKSTKNREGYGSLGLLLFP